MLSKRIVACLYRGISQRGQNNVPLYCCHRNTCVRSMSSNVKTDEDTTNGTLKKTGISGTINVIWEQPFIFKGRGVWFL